MRVLETDIEVINAFLQREGLSFTEKVLVDHIKETDKLLKENAKERSELVELLKEKESNFIKLSGSFDAQLKLILDSSKLIKNDEKIMEVGAESVT